MQRSWVHHLVTGSVLITLSASACGPSELPAFANPPPEDAATHAGQNDHDDDADAGEPGRDD